MVNKNELTIIVVGARRSGKTTLVSQIKDMLQEKDFKVSNKKDLIICTKSDTSIKIKEANLATKPISK